MKGVNIMKLKVKYTYEEAYLPTKRHRIPRYRDAEGETEVTINEVTAEDAPVALRVRNYDKTAEDYRWWNKKLWTKVMWHERYCGKSGIYPLDEFMESIKYHSDYLYHKDKENAEREKHDYVAKHLIIDGVVYKETGEPRYVSMTFGLGHNHGETSLMIDNYYNGNINKNCYFNALDRDKAIEYTKERAIRRGDTESIDRIGKSYNIEVLIPEAVRCNPQAEAGEGDEFLNKLYAITEKTSSAEESAILSLLVLAKEIEK
jgi:hypothetical protein